MSDLSGPSSTLHEVQSLLSTLEGWIIQLNDSVENSETSDLLQFVLPACAPIRSDLKKQPKCTTSIYIY